MQNNKKNHERKFPDLWYNAFVKYVPPKTKSKNDAYCLLPYLDRTALHYQKCKLSWR